MTHGPSSTRPLARSVPPATRCTLGRIATRTSLLSVQIAAGIVHSGLTVTRSGTDLAVAPDLGELRSCPTAKCSPRFVPGADQRVSPPWDKFQRGRETAAGFGQSNNSNTSSAPSSTNEKLAPSTSHSLHLGQVNRSG